MKNIYNDTICIYSYIFNYTYIGIKKSFAPRGVTTLKFSRITVLDC